MGFQSESEQAMYRLPDDSSQAPNKHLLVVLYDLPSEKHGLLRRVLKDSLGEEGGRWVRHQRSVLLISTKRTASEWSKWVRDKVGSDKGDRWLVVDISHAPHAGFGPSDIWRWVDEEKREARVNQLVNDVERGADRSRQILLLSQVALGGVASVPRLVDSIVIPLGLNAEPWEVTAATLALEELFDDADGELTLSEAGWDRFSRLTWRAVGYGPEVEAPLTDGGSDGMSA